LVDSLAGAMASAYGPKMPHVNYLLLVLSPEHYDTLRKLGLDSKEQMAQLLWKRTAAHMVQYLPAVARTMGLIKFPKVPPFVFTALAAIPTFVMRCLVALGVSVTAIPKFNTPDSFKIVVAGGEAGKFSSFIPSFGVGTEGMPTAFISRPVTVKVEPPPAKLDSKPMAFKGVDASAVLDPVAVSTYKGLDLVSRTGTLLQPVALMDISKAHGSELLDVYEAKLKAAGVATKRFAKPTFSRPAPEALILEISSSCKSAILGLAD
jgi:hypothetical protein